MTPRVEAAFALTGARNHCGGRESPDHPKVGRTPNFLRSFFGGGLVGVKDCAKLGIPF